MTWQPISTAPTDGTVIDLWAKGRRYPDCRWNYDHWEQEYAEVYGVTFDPFSMEDNKPSHWMKIPNPPEGITL